jgi:hypothetical protein
MLEHSRLTQAAQDGTPIWGKRAIDGPGVWVSCVKGKEKQTVGELYDLFESVSRRVAGMISDQTSLIKSYFFFFLRSFFFLRFL